MSWLGNGFSNITGQITNFTREVLTEGTEEIDDAATELRISSTKLHTLEQNVLQQKAEIERLRKAYDEVSEKLESSELQNTVLSQEYRAIVDHKEKELSMLKAREHAWTTSHPGARHGGGISGSDETVAETCTQPRLQQLEAENATLQQQVRQLTGEVTSKASTSPGEEDASVADVAKLNACIKALRRQLEEESTQHRHNVAQTQQLHSQKLTQLKQRHRDDVRKYEDQISELQDLLDVEGDADGMAALHVAQLSKLREREKDLEEQLCRQNADMEQLLAADRLKAQQLKQLKQQDKESMEQAKQLVEEVENLKAKYGNLLTELNDVKSKRESLKLQLAERTTLPATSTPLKHTQSPPKVDFDASVQLEVQDQAKSMSKSRPSHSQKRAPTQVLRIALQLQKNEHGRKDKEGKEDMEAELEELQQHVEELTNASGQMEKPRDVFTAEMTSMLKAELAEMSAALENMSVLLGRKE